MALTDLAVVSEQVQKVWAPLFAQELRESLLLASLVNKDYEGQIKQHNDTVYVSMIKKANGELKTVGVDADTFDSEQMQTVRVAVQANKVASASFEIASLAELQSQIGMPDAQNKLREALRFGVEKQVNDYLWSIINPSTSAPDHLLTGIATMDATQLAANRKLAAQAKWPKDGQWYGLLDPDYYTQILQAQTLTSQDYVDDQPVVGGQIANRRFGFNLLEDDSRGAKKGLFFHPDFMYYVAQTEPTFKVSDLHAMKKRGYLISVDLVFGAGLGIEGSSKHIYNTNGASLDP